jgi:hypothetical protein
MRDPDNPLRNISPNAFTVIQASHSEFHKELKNIPIRYPKGPITYLNNHPFVPLLQFKDEHHERLVHLKIHHLEEVLRVIEGDESPILFIEYHLSWFRPDTPGDLLVFTEVCKNRARRGGPVVLITAIMDRGLLELDGKADFIFQIGKTPLRGKRLEIKEQAHLDEYSKGNIEVRNPGKMYGQMKLGIGDFS